jgi:hypothetical protein
VCASMAASRTMNYFDEILARRQILQREDEVR